MDPLHRCGDPQLPIRLLSGTSPDITGEQGACSGTDQSLNHARVNVPLNQNLPLLFPVLGLELSQPSTTSRRQLLDPSQPFLSQVIPDLPQRCILHGGGGQAPSPLREAAQPAAVHQAEEPVAIDLERPQTVQQLLTRFWIL